MSKPWELPLADDTADRRVPAQREAKETDGLLAEKDCEKHGFIDDSCDYSLGLYGFMNTLSENFGPKLLWLLFAAQFLLKGFARDFTGKAEPYLYKLYNTPASQMQVYQGVTQLPWAIKPIIGLISDICPINGYNKAPYMFATSIVGVGCYLCVGVTSSTTLSVSILVMCLFMMQLQASTGDLLSEAKYAEKIRETPSHGPALLTYVWFGMQVGTFLAVILSGMIIASSGPHLIYLLAIIPAGAVLIPVAMNYMEETPLTSREATEAWNRFMNQGETIVLSIIMLFATVTLLIVGLTVADSYMVGFVAIGVALVVLLGFSVLLSPTIAKFNAFSLIQTSFGVSVSGASFYFYTDTPEQYPEGPHFTPFFYNSVIGAVTAVFSLFGIYCYNRYMTHWNYRYILLCTNLAYGLICLPDMVLFSRLNLQIGIPDHVFLIGSTVAQNTIFQWQWMPQVVILANLCPKGMEATMYALLAGCHNLGNTIAANCGAILLQSLGVQPSGQTGESAQFENLWKASMISSLLPLFYFHDLLARSRCETDR